jgi:hypothetical protein
LETPLAEKSNAEKLQIKPGRRVRFINAPKHFEELIGTLPEGTQVLDDSVDSSPSQPVNILILFALGFQDLQAHLSRSRTTGAPDGMIWAAYHIGTSRVKTDINRDSINTYAGTLGMKGVAMVSIDEDWAALRLKVV